VERSRRLLEKHGYPLSARVPQPANSALISMRRRTPSRSHGFPTLPGALLKIYYDDHEEIVRDFFARYQPERVIGKAGRRGSSIGVFAASSPAEAIEKVKLLFSRRMDHALGAGAVGPWHEFTVIVLENRFGAAVAIIPTKSRGLRVPSDF